MEDFTYLAWPLTRPTGKNTPWKWDASAQQAFELLMDRLTSAPILSFLDPTLPYILDIDASHEAVGGVLSQIQNGQERVKANFSKTLSAVEKNYCVTRKELLEVVMAVKHFRPHL